MTLSPAHTYPVRSRYLRKSRKARIFLSKGVFADDHDRYRRHRVDCIAQRTGCALALLQPLDHLEQMADGADEAATGRLEFVDLGVGRLILGRDAGIGDEVASTNAPETPKKATEIPGTGGVRKMRFGAKGKGKRGGARVIYYWYKRRRANLCAAGLWEERES